jgi:hypothetical protein
VAAVEAGGQVRRSSLFELVKSSAGGPCFDPALHDEFLDLVTIAVVAVLCGSDISGTPRC